MKRILRMAAVVLAIVLAAPTLNAQRSPSPEILLETGRQMESLHGDLAGAAKHYQMIADTYGTTNPETAAKALLALADVYQRMGGTRASAATDVYQRILREHPRQTQIASIARARLEQVPVAGQLLERPLSTCSAPDNVIDVSEDGRSVLSDKDGDLVLWDPGTCGARTFVAQDKRGNSLIAFPGDAKFSRDGKQVAYNWRRQDALPIVDELRVVAVTGSSEPRVLIRDNRTSGYGVVPMDWSPDGARVFVTIAHLEDGVRQIGYVEVATGALTVLRTLEWRGPWRLAVSPDGKYLAYDLPASEQSTARDVFLVAVDGSAGRAVLPHPANDQLVSWMPDGRLVLTSDRLGSKGLWTQRIVDGRPQGDPVLLRGNLPGVVEDLTPAGDVLLRVSTGGYTIHTSEVDWNTGRLLAPSKAIAVSPFALNPPPDWSPDGKLLAYLSAAGDDDVMAIRTLATGQTRTIPLNVAAVISYRWMPDGRAFLAHVADLKNRIGIARIDATSGEVTPIAMPPAPTRYTRPQLSADGKKLFYFANVEKVVNGQVTRVTSLVERDLTSSAEKTIFKPEGRPAGVFGAMSPDGRYLAAVAPGKETMGLVLIDLSTGTERQLNQLTSPAQYLGAPVAEWTPDSRAMVVRKAYGEGKPMEAWVVPIDGSEAKKVDLGVANYSGFQIKLSPDGKQIVFTAGHRPTTEFRMIERLLAANR